MEPILYPALAAWLLAAGLMLILWAISIPLRNAGLVDIGWAGGLALIALLYFVLVDGYLLRRALVTAMGLIWGLRLGSYLLVRTVGREEEGRYRYLRLKWGSAASFRFFFFFQFQAVLDVIFSLPLLLAAVNPDPRLSILELVGFGLWLVAVAGEATADRQLQRFKDRSESAGQVCREGLWGYSRHPNYFFEWLVWVAFFLFALPSPRGWIAIVCPALMLLFLFRITGIPANEQQALRSKGDAYRDYQRTTSPFIPWFPRKHPE